MQLLPEHGLLAWAVPNGGDMMIIAVLVLLLFGVKKLPLFARSLGRSMGEFRKAKEEFEQEPHRAVNGEPAPRPRDDAPYTALNKMIHVLFVLSVLLLIFSIVSRSIH